MGAKLKPYPLGPSLKQIQGILTSYRPMDKDCFNMVVLYIGMRRYTIIYRASRAQYGLKILCKLLYSHVILIILMFLTLCIDVVDIVEWHKTS